MDKLFHLRYIYLNLETWKYLCKFSQGAWQMRPETKHILRQSVVKAVQTLRCIPTICVHFWFWRAFFAFAARKIGNSFWCIELLTLYTTFLRTCTLRHAPISQTMNTSCPYLTNHEHIMPLSYTACNLARLVLTSMKPCPTSALTKRIWSCNMHLNFFFKLDISLEHTFVNICARSTRQFNGLYFANAAASARKLC